MIRNTESQRGASLAVTIIIAVLALLVIGVSGLAVWSYLNYTDQKENVNAKIDKAVALAEKEQGDRLAKEFQEAEKKPNLTFSGPADFGSLSFSYPKTWSVYVDSDGRKNDKFEAYLNPVVVPPVAKDERFALRVSITSESYEDVIKKYQSLVKKGDLKSSATKANGVDGTRLDGAFSKDIRGSAVVYKIRDKTAVIQTDADTFKPDYEALIKTIKFKQ